MQSVRNTKCHTHHPPPTVIQIVEMWIKSRESLHPFRAFSYIAYIIYTLYKLNLYIQCLCMLVFWIQMFGVWVLHILFFVSPQTHRLLAFNMYEIENVNRDSFDVNAFCFDACYCIVHIDASRENLKWKGWKDGWYKAILNVFKQWKPCTTDFVCST